MTISQSENFDNRLPRAALIALGGVVRALATTEGRRQFYGLAHVQSVILDLRVERHLIPWVVAALVSRDDFDALYRLRDTPGTYAQLRECLSAAAGGEATALIKKPDECERCSDDSWLDLVAELLNSDEV